ncbi:MAG: LysR family transcriptional regulator [Herminiimonas sp.]|nr:LysR family transcriptional regulator [Herminiimonas sp.]
MSLLAFEAASRHLSFTSAAQELELTQTAISHQIKNLEERLGTKLFIRRRNVLQLTPDAREYLESVREAIGLLSMATKRAKGEKTNDLLTISCLPTYAVKCLLPALPEFQRAYPEITVQLFASASFDQFKRKSHDVAIRYGTGRWPALHAERLHGEEFFPVCSPKLLNEVGAGSNIEQLARMTQIRTFFSSTYQDDWPVWLEASGIESVDFSGEAIFNLQLTSMQAAVEGVGIAIGRTPLVNPDLANGSLVAPFDLRLETASAYYVVSPADKAQLDKVRLFREWALERLHE